MAVGRAETDPTCAPEGALIRPKPKPRSAITDAAKLGGLLRASDGFQGQTVTRLGLSLLVLLVPRPGEQRKARWVESDFSAKIWSIPAERMKMRRPHQVPPPGPAIAILNKLRLLTGAGDFVFPSLRSLLRTMSENTLNVALRIMGFGGYEITSHGFRATFSTLANESGLWHHGAIERALAHVDENAVRRADARGEHWDEPVRMADWWAALLDHLRKGQA